MEELVIHVTVNLSRHRPVVCCAVLHVQCGPQACAALHISLGHRITSDRSL